MRENAPPCEHCDALRLFLRFFFFFFFFFLFWVFFFFFLFFFPFLFFSFSLRKIYSREASNAAAARPAPLGPCRDVHLLLLDRLNRISDAS